MADGRSSKGSKPGNKRAAGEGSCAASRQRRIVIDGIFSIEEIEVKSTSRRKATANTRKKSKGNAKPKVVPNAKASKKVAKRANPTTRKKQAPAIAGPIVLASSPGIKTINELKAALTEAYGADSSIVVDASGVESIDTAALQLLVAFANYAREQSRTIEWKDASTGFREMLELADLSLALGVGVDAVAAEDDGLCPVF